MMPCERKSVEPMAAITAPERTAAQHQSLLHFVGEGKWSDEKVLAKVRELVLPKIEQHGPIEAWIIDDTGFPKKGKHSVGVARQYCGQLGKQDNCQVAVSLSLANHHASLPAAYRLYLPEDWAGDDKRRRKAGVPDEIGFKTKPEIALEQITSACKAGLPRGVVLMDAGYGCNTNLRTSINALTLQYVAGILPNTSVWAPGPPTCRYRQAALAHRTRLSGTKAGSRARTFRRTRMARLPPSRHTVHRSLRISGLREGDDSPLKTSCLGMVQRTCRSRRLPTERIRHCGLNVTSQTQSPQCVDA
jgi:SRSO17 transposase